MKILRDGEVCPIHHVTVCCGRTMTIGSEIENLKKSLSERDALLDEAVKYLKKHGGCESEPDEHLGCWWCRWIGKLDRLRAGGEGEGR